MSYKKGWNDAWRLTVKWLAIGTIEYLLDWVTYKASHLPYHHQLAILFYWIMPVIVGLPVAWVDNKIYERTSKLKFYWSFLIRTLIYVSFSLVAGALFFVVEHDIFDVHSRGWLIVKFVGFWLPASLFVLTIRNLMKHFDKKTILEWVQGNYHHPSEQERIFLFVDIKDSTTIAESIGHQKYFKFIHAFHNVAAEAIHQNKGEIYQYIGDEIVITWPLKEGLHNNNAINLFFEIENALARESVMFQEQFGRIPTIKGALHAGKVTRGEIGKAKKEFSYVGDVLNTTSRMQSVAKKTPGISLVVSEKLLKGFPNLAEFNYHPLGNHALRGKNELVFLYTVQSKEAELSTLPK